MADYTFNRFRPLAFSQVPRLRVLSTHDLSGSLHGGCLNREDSGKSLSRREDYQHNPTRGTVTCAEAVSAHVSPAIISPHNQPRASRATPKLTSRLGSICHAVRVSNQSKRSHSLPLRQLPRAVSSHYAGSVTRAWGWRVPSCPFAKSLPFLPLLLYHTCKLSALPFPCDTSIPRLWHFPKPLNQGSSTVHYSSYCRDHVHHQGSIRRLCRLRHHHCLLRCLGLLRPSSPARQGCSLVSPVTLRTSARHADFL